VIKDYGFEVLHALLASRMSRGTTFIILLFNNLTLDLVEVLAAEETHAHRSWLPLLHGRDRLRTHRHAVRDRGLCGRDEVGLVGYASCEGRRHVALEVKV